MYMFRATQNKCNFSSVWIYVLLPLVLDITSLFLSLSRSPFLDDSAKDLCNPGERFSQIRFLLNKFTQYSVP